MQRWLSQMTCIWLRDLRLAHWVKVVPHQPVWDQVRSPTVDQIGAAYRLWGAVDHLRKYLTWGWWSWIWSWSWSDHGYDHDHDLNMDLIFWWNLKMRSSTSRSLKGWLCWGVGGWWCGKGRSRDCGTCGRRATTEPEDNGSRKIVLNLMMRPHSKIKLFWKGVNVQGIIWGRKVSQHWCQLVKINPTSSTCQ